MMTISSIKNQPFIKDQPSTLTIPSEASTYLEGKIEVGEILKAQVQAIYKDSKVSLDIKGKNFTAFTNLSFNKGEIIDLQVKELTPQIIFQLIPQGENQVYANKYTHLDLKNILKSLEVPVNKENINIVAKLLEYNLPLNKEVILEINKNLQALNLNHLSDIETLVFLKAKDIPFSPTSFHCLKQYLFEKISLFDYLNNLKETLKNLPLEKDLKQQFDRFFDQLSALSLEKDKFSINLKDFLSNLGLVLDPEKEVNLKKLLLKLKDYLISDQKDFSYPALPKLLETLDQTLLYLTSLQLLNQDGGDLRYLYWEIPYQISSYQEPVKIKIKYQKKKKGEKINLNDLSISFLFITSGLGNVALNIHLKDKLIHGQISLEDFVKKNFALNHIEELQANLTSIGYQEAKIDCRILPIPEKEFYEDRSINLDNLSKIDLKI
ncbi:MAG: hypothetical protein ABIG09_02915 [bacterium]